MFVKTKNVYGQIAISNKSIAKFVAHVAADCYGRVPDELWNEVHDIVQEAMIKTIPKKKNCKKAKWLSTNS